MPHPEASSASPRSEALHELCPSTRGRWPRSPPAPCAPRSSWSNDRGTLPPATRYPPPRRQAQRQAQSRQVWSGVAAEPGTGWPEAEVLPALLLPSSVFPVLFCFTGVGTASSCFALVWAGGGGDGGALGGAQSRHGRGAVSSLSSLKARIKGAKVAKPTSQKLSQKLNSCMNSIVERGSQVCSPYKT